MILLYKFRHGTFPVNSVGVGTVFNFTSMGIEYSLLTVWVLGQCSTLQVWTYNILCLQCGDMTLILLYKFGHGTFSFNSVGVGTVINFTSMDIE